jgi:hypothetical protein
VFQIDEALTAFLHSGIAAQVGSADAHGRPQVVIAWGPRLNDDQSLSVFVDTARAGKTLANLATNRNVALICADPISYRSVQFKGHWLSASAPNEVERAWVQRHRELFASALALVGDNPEAIRNMWMQDTTRIDFTVDEAYDQTPGPLAGRPL